MAKIDNAFLEEVGLDGLMGEKRQAFIQHTEQELELRIGQRMSSDLSEEQMQDFEGIMNNDSAVMEKYIARIGDYQNDDIYRRLLRFRGANEETPEILNEYLSIKWIQINRPDYREIVKMVLETLKAEIRANAGQILAA